ncbi:hypothetical protein BDF19DRAFT_411808 [Syncephalis fuscata]|nr:hypothetical protein BDF19DRAFT_411808 [Syncephalis fuscata]
MDTGGDPISDMEYDSKTAPSTTDANTTTSAYRANTPTPGEYFPDGLNPEEDGELIEHVRHLFGKLVHNNQNVITASDLGPLFSQLDKERKLRLNEPAKDMINSMAQAQGDITITMSQVIDLIPQLRELAPASPASRGGTPGQGRSSIPRPNSMAPSSPMSSRREYGALLPKSGSKKTNTDLWTKQQQQQQANGADYEYFGSEDEGQYRDRRNSTGRRYLARDLLRSPTDVNEFIVHNLESPTKSRHSNMFSRHRSDSPNLPSSPLSPGVLARRAKFMSNTMEEPEDYPGDEEMSHADLVNEITNLRREMADYKRRQKESEEHVGTMARQHDEAVAILQQKMDEMQNAISIKKRHILELQGNEKHHREQITLLENEAQKYTKNIKVLRSQLTKMKTQYEEKCADEEKLFAQLRVKDEELQTSESSIEQLATDQRRSAEERLQLERALRRLENDVICAQEFEREHELLQKENQELKRIVKQMKAEHEAWSNRAPVQIPDSLGRASLVTAEAARTGRNLKSEIGNSSFDNDDVLTNNLPKTKTDANNQKYFIKRHTDNVELLNKVNQYPTESADTSIHEEGHLHRDIYHHIDILRNENEVLQQQKDRIMSDNNRVQEDLRRQLQKANNDKENLILQLEKMRKNGTTGPIIHTQGTQCELLLPSDLNHLM